MAAAGRRPRRRRAGTHPTLDGRGARPLPAHRRRRRSPDARRARPPPSPPGAAAGGTSRPAAARPRSAEQQHAARAHPRPGVTPTPPPPALPPGRGGHTEAPRETPTAGGSSAASCTRTYVWTPEGGGPVWRGTLAVAVGAGPSRA